MDDLGVPPFMETTIYHSFLDDEQPLASYFWFSLWVQGLDPGPTANHKFISIYSKRMVIVNDPK